MKPVKYFAFLFLVAGVFTLYGLDKPVNRWESRKKAKELHSQAMGFYKKKDYDGARKKWHEAAEADPYWWKPDYNMACLDSLEKKLSTVTDHLEKAFALLMKDEIEVADFVRFYRYIQTDSDFTNYRKTAEYKKFLAKMQGYAPELFNLTFSGRAMGVGPDEGSELVCNIPEGKNMAGAAYYVKFKKDGSYSMSVAAGPSYEGRYYFNKKDSLLSLSLVREDCYDDCVKSNEDSRQKVSWFDGETICIENTCYCDNYREP